jgi:predicted nucleic acid-binding protein
MANRRIVLDSNVLVALISDRDSLHAKADELIRAFQGAQVELVYLDCVMSETLSVLGRRAEEQNRAAEFPALVDRLSALAPEANIVWLSANSRRLYAEVVALMRLSSGRLNFNDCLIALGCRELGLNALASFDPDFDSVSWLSRIGDPSNLALVS